MKWIEPIVISLTIVAVLLYVAGPRLVSSIFSDIQGRDHVADQDLISGLEVDKVKYQRLVSMFREDAPVTEVHPNWINPDKVISQARWDDYKVLFSELGLDSGMRSWGGESIWFISTSQGLVTGGSSKGYMYKPESPHPLFTSLDKIPKGLESNVKGYRKISDDWYIVLEWDD